MYSNLFSEIKIGNQTIKNRIVMTAMGNHLADPEGAVSDRDIAFYAARAKGGCGLIITECVAVDWKHGKGNMAQMSADNDSVIEGYRKMAEEIHRYGGKLAVQIYHPGRQGITVLNGVESMPSASSTECQCVHQPAHEMSKREILEMEQKFVQAALAHPESRRRYGGNPCGSRISDQPVSQSVHKSEDGRVWGKFRKQDEIPG